MDFDPQHQDQAATVVGRRGARSDRSPSSSGPPLSTPPETPDSGAAAILGEDEAIADIVFAAEATRTRNFSAIALVLITLVGVQMPFLGGDPLRRRYAMIAIALMFAIAAWAFLRTGRPGGYSRTVFRIEGWGLATCILAVEHYIGFFSPMTVVLSLGIYVLGQSTDRLHALLIPLYVTASWVVGCLLILTGVVEDRSLYAASYLVPSSQVLMITGVAAALLMSLWVATVARASVRRAILDANQALLEAQKGAALLQEAHNQLDRAMRLVVGKPGLHSGSVAGDYRLGVIIGMGAMGEVYAAEHVDSRDIAAVKLLHAEALRREDMVARFLREAEVCTRFDHRNIVRVHAVGRMEGGAPYMAMERVSGTALSQVLRERGHLSLDEVVELAEELCAGLSHAHDNGVVHRDLKPHNILRARDERGQERWQILDFGISKLVDSTGTLTGNDGVLGTPAYMSPEQATGREVDHRSDVFALGAVLYRALTGRPAFPGKDAPSTMFQVVYCMPERPSHQVDGLTRDVDFVLAVALAKDPEDRYQSAKELGAALRAARDSSLAAALRSRGRMVLHQRPWGSTPSDQRV